MAAKPDTPHKDQSLSDDAATHEHAHQQQDGFFEPEPRAMACGSVVDGKFILYRGLQESFKKLDLNNLLRVATVDAFDPSLPAWETRRTTGPNPQAVFGSACTCIGPILYAFAGFTGTQYTNELHAFNTLSSVWKQHHPCNPSEGPMRKAYCGMIAIDDSTLVIVAGIGIPSGDIQPGSRFVKRTGSSEGQGWTNELHKYDLNDDLWSSPTTSGEPLPLCEDFTFTKVDLFRAVFVGGFQGDIRQRVSTAYVLNFMDWVWTRLLQKGPYQLPARSSHTAFSLHDPDSNPAHPAVVISCGRDSKGNALGDMCILRVTDGSCEEIPLPPSFIARYAHTSGVLYISPGKLKIVNFGGRTEKRDPNKSWQEDVFTAHTTVVELERAEGREGSAAGWTTTVKVARVEAIYSEALQHGYSVDRPTVVLLTGAAGSGKSHVRYLLLNLPPPPIRHSTPLAETPVRAISASTAVASGDSFHEVKVEEEDQLLAHSIASGVRVSDSSSPPAIASSLVEECSQSSQQGEQEIHSVSQHQPQASPPVPEPVSIEQPAAQLETLQPDLTPNTDSPTDDLTNLDSDFPDESTLQGDASAVATQLGDELKAFLNPGSKSDSTVPQGDSIYIVDSGGQPQYPHIFPLLMQPPLVTLHVTNLSERLDQHPVVEYYKQGRRLKRSYKSPFTNEQLVMHAVRGVELRTDRPTFTSAAPTPKMAIIGTHRDQVGWFSESIAQKNTRLVQRLCPHFERNLVFCGEDTQRLIFPVNAKKPGPRDKAVMQQVRAAICTARDRVERIKTPTAWRILMKALLKLCQKQQRYVLTKQEGLAVASQVHMDAEKFEVALHHLARIALVHYFPEILPELVFCKSQVLLDKVTELVESWYESQSNPDPTKASDIDTLPFREEGMITHEILAAFSSHYVADGNVFTSSHLLKLMERRHLVARVSPTDFFMPAILLELPGAELEMHRVPSSSPVAPLAIYFEDGIPPCGLFCSIVSTMLSSGELELARDPSTRMHPKLVARNCVRFRMPGGLGGEVVFIDAFSHYELHVHSHALYPGSVYSKLSSGLLHAIKQMALAMNIGEMQPLQAFICQSDDHHLPQVECTRLSVSRRISRRFSSSNEAPPTPVRHVATVSSDGRHWTCSVDPANVHGQLEQRHLMWTAESPHQCEKPTPKELIVIKWVDENGELQKYRVRETFASQWKSLGTMFGFSIGFLDSVAEARLPERCWDAVISRWLQDGSEEYPTTWQGLVAALEDVGGFAREIEKLQTALHNRGGGD